MTDDRSALFCGLTLRLAKTSLLSPDLKADTAISVRRRLRSQRGRERALTEIKLKKGESVESAQPPALREADRTAPAQDEDSPILGDVELPLR